MFRLLHIDSSQGLTYLTERDYKAGVCTTTKVGGRGQWN